MQQEMLSTTHEIYISAMFLGIKVSQVAQTHTAQHPKYLWILLQLQQSMLHERKLK